jgi:hypothetical protein
VLLQLCSVQQQLLLQLKLAGKKQLHVALWDMAALCHLLCTCCKAARKQCCAELCRLCCKAAESKQRLMGCLSKVIKLPRRSLLT